jgi:allantoin racemase
MLKICCIAPVIESSAITEARYQAFLDAQFADWKDVKFVGRLLDCGPSSLDNEMDDALAVPGVLRAGLAAAAENASGILIDCMLDPGLRALRTAVHIPVVGAAEISFRLAATLGEKFGIIDVGDHTAPMVAAQVRSMGLSERYAGLYGTGLQVERIASDRELTLERLANAAVALVESKGADVLVLGCTEFSSHTDSLREVLRERQIDVPVINPTALAAGTLVALVRSGAAHSKRAYPSPSDRKRLVGFDLQQFYRSGTD